MTFQEAYNAHRSDKSSKHEYHRVYDAFFRMLPRSSSVLEVGVFKGNGMKALAALRPDLKIAGIDLFSRVPLESVAQVVRGTLIKGDSTKVELGETYDVIIDDGCHFPGVQRDTFENLYPYLNPGGTYFIEDVWMKPGDHPWKTKHADNYRDEDFARLHELIELYDVTIRDLTPITGEPDSCIWEIKA